METDLVSRRHVKVRRTATSRVARSLAAQRPDIRASLALTSEGRIVIFDVEGRDVTGEYDDLSAVASWSRWSRRRSGMSPLTVGGADHFNLDI